MVTLLSFYRYETPEEAYYAVKVLNESSFNGTIIKVERDWGFSPDRQYARGKNGCQVCYTAEVSIRNHRSPMKCQASITTLTMEDRGDIMARTEEEGTTERTTTTEDPTSDITTTIKTIITEEDVIIIKLGLLSVVVCF